MPNEEELNQSGGQIIEPNANAIDFCMIEEGVLLLAIIISGVGKRQN